MNVKKRVGAPYFKNFGKKCPECRMPTSVVPMIYDKEGNPVRPIKGWVTEEGFTLECINCSAAGADRDTLFFVHFEELPKGLSKKHIEELMGEIQEIEEKYQ